MGTAVPQAVHSSRTAAEGTSHETRPVPRALGFEPGIRSGDARTGGDGESSTLQTDQSGVPAPT